MSNVTHMTKSEKLRKASKLCWALGSFFTWQLMMSIMSSIQEPAIRWVAAAVAALAAQYVLSLLEGTIIDGILPGPHNLDFRNHPTQSILAVLVYGSFLVDVLVNLGGVYVATSKLGLGDLQGVVGISTYIIGLVQLIVTVFLSILFALGSEALDALADQYEGKKQNRPNFSYDNKPQEHNRQNQNNQQQKQSRNLTNEEIAAIKRAAAEEANRTRGEVAKAEPANTPFKERLAANRAARNNGRNL
jgi:hypothetical protein